LPDYTCVEAVLKLSQERISSTGVAAENVAEDTLESRAFDAINGEFARNC
jgi:hypothetical protein